MILSQFGNRIANDVSVSQNSFKFYVIPAPAFVNDDSSRLRATWSLTVIFDVFNAFPYEYNGSTMLTSCKAYPTSYQERILYIEIPDQCTMDERRYRIVCFQFAKPNTVDNEIVK